jgi:hypothetical protein
LVHVDECISNARISLHNLPVDRDTFHKITPFLMILPIRSLTLRRAILGKKLSEKMNVRCENCFLHGTAPQRNTPTPILTLAALHCMHLKSSEPSGLVSFPHIKHVLIAIADDRDLLEDETLSIWSLCTIIRIQKIQLTLKLQNLSWTLRSDRTMLEEKEFYFKATY